MKSLEAANDNNVDYNMDWSVIYGYHDPWDDWEYDEPAARSLADRMAEIEIAFSDPEPSFAF